MLGLMWINRHKEPLILALLGLALTAWLFHHPLAAQPGHTVGRAQSEQLVGVWANQLVLENLIEHGRLPWHAEGVAYEAGGVIYPMSLPTALLSLPFYWALDMTALYTVAMMLNFMLGLAGAYLLFRHLAGGRAWIALPGALLFSLNPFCLESFAMGPVEASALGWIPLALLAVERLDGSRPFHHLVRAGALAICFAGNPYYGTFTMAAAAYLLLTRADAALASRLRGAAMTLVLAVLLIAPMAWAMNASLAHPQSLLPQRGSPEDLSFHRLFIAREQVVDLASLVLPTKYYNSPFQHVGFYLGIPALLACGLALARLRRSRRWFWLALGMLVFSVGGGLRVADWQAGGDLTPLHMPAYWLCMYVPGFSSIFYPYRALPLVLLSMGAMITLLLARREMNRRRMTLILLSLLIAADLLLVFRGGATLPALPYKAPLFYQGLAREHANYGVMDLPPPGNDIEKGRILLDQLHHRKRVPYTLEMIPFWGNKDPRALAFWNGFKLTKQLPNHARNWDIEADRFGCDEDCPGLSSIWELGYRYIVLNRTGHQALDSKLIACMETCDVALYHKDAKVRVYQKPGPRPPKP